MNKRRRFKAKRRRWQARHNSKITPKWVMLEASKMALVNRIWKIVDVSAGWDHASEATFVRGVGFTINDGGGA